MHFSDTLSLGCTQLFIYVHTKRFSILGFQDNLFPKTCFCPKILGYITRLILVLKYFGFTLFIVHNEIK